MPSMRKHLHLYLQKLPAVEVLRQVWLQQYHALKLGKQASGYKTAQKALNRFITEVTS